MALQFYNDCAKSGSFVLFFSPNAMVKLAAVKRPSASLGQVCGHVRGHAVLNLGVGDRPVFLSQVQAQLALVTKVQVAFLTL